MFIFSPINITDYITYYILHYFIIFAVPTPLQHRLLLDQSNLLCRVRFLRMSREEFAQVKATGILTHEEAEQIQQCILLLESPLIASSNISNCSSLPAGFSPLTTPRNAPVCNMASEFLILAHVIYENQNYFIIIII